MRIRKIIKRIGKSFFNLRQENERVIGQSVLIVDNGYSWLGHVDSAIKRIQNYFPKAEISVLTFSERKSNLEKDFPSVKFILPSQRVILKRYQIALQMLKIGKKRYDFIVLFSLDTTPLIVALIFFKSKVVLYNQWGQWWSLRFRRIEETFKITYVKKKTRFNFKNLLKRIGLFFLLLERKDEEILKHSILVIDNGYAPFGHIGYAIQQIKKLLPQAKISVLALEQRRELKDNFPDLEIIKPDKCLIKRYRIARHMLRLRKNRYDYIILLSLDITPIFASILFMNSRVLLYNQWHQWWSLKPKSIWGNCMAIPRFTYNIIIFVYLLISVSWIFLKRSFNLFRFNLLRKRT